MTRNTLVAEPGELLSDSFPYVLWRLMPLVYSFQPLPRTAERQAAADWIGDLSRSLKRRCVLVLGPEECIYYEPDGTQAPSNQPPTGGIAFRASIAVPDLPPGRLN